MMMHSLAPPSFPAAARRRAGHDPLTMAFHWATLLLLAALFASVLMRSGAQDGQSAALLLTVHRSLGVALWSLTLVRLGWRAARRGRPVPLPRNMGPLQRFAAAANHGALYVLLFLQPVTGFLQTVARGKPFTLFGATVPALVPRDKAVAHVFHAAHETGANILLALIALHVLAALAHGLRRDGVLEAMLPLRRS